MDERKESGERNSGWFGRVALVVVAAAVGYYFGVQRGELDGRYEGRADEAANCRHRIEEATNEASSACRDAVGRICDEPQPPYGQAMCERIAGSLR